MQIAPAGDRALLVTLGEVSAAELHARAAGFRAVPGVIACVPGHASVLVVFAGVPDVRSVEAAVPAAAGTRDARRHTIPVHFDGVDLPEFLSRTSQSLSSFESRVATLRLTARYLGFRGGFAYLDGWPQEWAMPRRATSRPLVARGTFAIAGAVAGFYPIDSPGGWNLLGRTGEGVENRFAAGDEIRIECHPERQSRDLGGGERRAPRPPGSLDSARDDMGLEILSGPLVTVVDAIDWSRVERGLPPGGPFDDVAAAIANRAVGNDESASLLECPMVGPRIRMREAKTIAWFDGDVKVEQLEAGEERDFGRVKHGLRGYLAIGTNRPTDQPTNRPTSQRTTIQTIPGPHDIGLRDLECEVTPKLDRVGIRMTPLQRIDVRIPADLKSCGMLCGTMQLHPDGSVVVMGPDHPVTGGYLQPMTVISSERWKLAQLAPGERVRFVAVQPPY